MSDHGRLERQYEDELAFVRRLGAEFAKDRPKIAKRLEMRADTGETADPHVERLIEAFAFLTARIRLKLDDEFPELTEALLGILYPHYLAPIPSMGVLQFQVDPERGKLPQGHAVKAGAQVNSLGQIDGASSSFRTAYPVTLWPLVVTGARYQTTPFGRELVPPPGAVGAKAVVRIELKAGAGMAMSALEIPKLRFYISGDQALTGKLYELLFDHLAGATLQAGDDPSSPRVDLGRGCLAQVGFGRDEGLLPYDRRSFLGYRLLTEYFAFPKKFLFFDVLGLDKLHGAGFTDRAELCLYLDRAERAPEPRVSAENFRLGCTPIVNLFTQDEIRIPLSQTRAEYQVIPDTRLHQQGAVEVYSIDHVQSTNVQTGESRIYEPFYSFKHDADPESRSAYWFARRRASVRRDDRGSDVFLSFVDLDFQPTSPAAEVITLRATCTNRDLPATRLASGAEWQFDLQEQAPLQARGQGVITVENPTAPVRPDSDRLRWRLISHLSLNHLSIADDEDGAEALREILRLYEFAENRANAQHIEGIKRVSSRRRVAPLGRDGQGPGFGRGVEIEIEFDHDKFAGAGVFLFGCVLDRFLALSATLNSVTRLAANLKQPGGEFRKKEWEWRMGDQTVL